MEIPQAHAATTLTGKVCFADPTTAVRTSPCPASPPTFDGPLGQQIRIGVFISGDNGTDGFDITLRANSTFLRPFDVDLTGTVLKGTPIIVQECLQGILKKGTTCAKTDSVDTIHFVAFSALGQPSTPTPTNGLLFTAIYNVTATTTSAITVDFQTGCVPPTSVSPDVCVSIASGYGAKTPNPETIQTASFSNSSSATMAQVDLSASPTSFGPQFPNTANTATLTATAVHGYPGTAHDSVTFTATASPGLSLTITGLNPCATKGSSCSVTLSLTAAAFGNYSATVSGTYATLDPTGNHDTLVATVTLTVIVYDFGFTINPTTLTFNSATTGQTTVTLNSVNGFAGSVTLSNGLILPPGLNVNYNPVSVTLAASGPDSIAASTVTFSASPTASTTYLMRMHATSGANVKESDVLTINVVVGPDYTITASPASLPPVDIGIPASSTIMITAIQGFTDTVSLTSSTNSTALTCNLNPASVASSGNSTLTCTGSARGSYNANVTGTDSTGTLVHSVVVTFTISPPTPDFNVTATPTVRTVLARAIATSIISIKATHGFTGTVLLTDSVSPSTGLLCTLSNTTITLGSSGTSNLSCSGSGGAYTVTITVSNGALIHTAQVSVIVQDFTITAGPASVNVNATVSGSSTITVTPQQGFAGSVGLSFSLNPNSGLSCTLTPTTVPGGSGSSILSCHGSAGSYQANVTGTSGSISHSVMVTFTVEDFSLSASPATITFATGGSGTSTITVSPLQGFSGTVTLTLASDTGVTAGLNPTSVLGGSGASTLTVSGSVAGAFMVNVTGTSGSLAHTVTVHITVLAIPDFKLTANPTTIVTNPNVTASSTITVTALNGLTGTIHLNFTTVAGIFCMLGPTSIVLGASGTSTLSCTGQAGIYPVTVWGTNGTATRFTVVRVEVQDFTISASSPVNFNVGGTATAITVTLTSTFNYAGSISLSSNASPTIGLVVTCPASTPITANATVTASCTLTSSTVGTYAVTITGSVSPATIGTIPHHASSTVHVGDFTISVNSPVDLNSGAAGSTITVTLASTFNFAGTISLTSAINPTTGLTITCPTTATAISANATVTASCALASTTAGLYSVTITGSGSLSSAVHSASSTVHVGDFTISASIPATFNVGGSDTITVTLKSMFNLAGSISLTAVVSPATALAVSCPASTSITANATVTPSCTLSSTLLGNYTVTITGNASPGSASHSAPGSTIHVGDFVLTESPVEITIVEGSSSSEAKVLLASANGFSGTITLTGQVGVPPGYTGTVRPTVDFSSTTATLTAGQTATIDVIVTVSNNVLASPFGINVTATSGGRSQSRGFGLTVPPPKFSITSSPASVVFAPGGTGLSTVVITSLGGLTGTVSLSLTSPSGVTCSLASSSISLPKGGTSNTQLSCGGAVGSYDLTITGRGTAPNGGSITEQGLIHIVAADFSLSSTPTGILVNTGQTGHARISISWTGSYNGTVQFRLVPDTGLDASLTSTTVIGSGITTLNVSSNTAGTYTLVVNGTSGSSSHAIRLTVTAISTTPSPVATIFGLDPTLFYAIIGVVIVAVAAGVVWQVRRPKRSK